ncbi:MATE family efflux transporter [bacterium]|nr:MAG: MATE family efflux transporter [bacterium]RKZ15126.1 MAG: MATE family efflux transporter [bacterium]
MSWIRPELRRLLELAAPLVVTQLASMMLGVVDTMMVGRVSVQVLGAAALGHVWTFGTLVFAMGVILGMDPLVTQAHGSGDALRQGRALQRGVVLALILSIPVGALWMFTGRAMLLLGQEPELAQLAQSYARVQLPGLPFFLVYTALRQYLAGRGIIRPAMVVAIVANLINVAGNWGLIFGHLGLPALGIVGAGWATTCTRIFMALVLIAWTLRKGLARGGWVPWSRQSFSPRGLGEIATHGWPVALQFGLEVWAFQTASLVAGRIGQAELAAHTVVLNVASVSFMIPMGISMAAVTRVGNLIGAGQPHRAQRASWVAMATGASVMAVFALVFVLFRWQIPLLYNPDRTVQALAASVFPIAAAFQLFDGTQVVGSGVLRGMGRTRPAALFNLIGYYFFALPLGWYMTFNMGLGLRGLWAGLALGLAAVAMMLTAWIRHRGPAWQMRQQTQD